MLHRPLVSPLNRHRLQSENRVLKDAVEQMRTARGPEEVGKAQRRIEDARAQLYQACQNLQFQVMQTNMEMSRRASEARGAELGVTPVQLACPECGSTNVNWKQVSGRRRIRDYAKKHGLDVDQVKKGLPYCIRCSGKFGRDVILENLSLSDIQRLKERKLDKRIGIL